ncbi:MAG TPA: hydroxymethylbilane synthase [Nitrososphaeraceae archaeon]|jgi:hydroxymethylbilane synthase|nr:hydroxymethylbilane synthase [Nitrososphaeraceae archaeon]HET8792586.1 hydroxymethylbilane synthase [Nitrososphaeraceae archaeon]
MTKILRVGTRGSKLALAQTKLVIDSLAQLNYPYEFKIVSITTKGDMDSGKPLFYLDRKGIFEKEINESVVNGDVDFAIHSLKDLPAVIHPDLTIASIPKRESVNDVLISKEKKRFDQIPYGSTIGTSSLRRAVQIISLRNDLKVLPIRGNIDTRIEKTIKGNYDAIVLAEAGLKRLGKEEYISEKFKINQFLPAPGQGALAIVCKKSNRNLLEFLQKIEHTPSRISINAERSFISKIEGGCRFPIAAYANLAEKSSKINFYAKIFSSDGLENIAIKKIGKYDQSEELGNRVANHLIQNGALRLAEGWDKALNEWNKR